MGLPCEITGYEVRSSEAVKMESKSSLVILLRTVYCLTGIHFNAVLSTTTDDF